MSTGTTAAPAAVSERHVLAEARPARPTSQWRRALSFGNIGAVYVWLLIILVFAIWVPNTFLTQTTFNQILNNKSPGDKVSIKYWSRGQVKTASVALSEIRDQ